MALKEKLYSLRLGEGKSIDSHLQEVNFMVHQLAGLGIIVVDEDLVELILMSLPKSWATFRQIHKHSLPSFPVLEGLLLQEEVTRELEHAKEKSKGVLYAGQRGNFWDCSPMCYQGRGRVYQGPIVIHGSSDQQWQTTVCCYKCNKTGYIART
jgi:hypothetical protein